jgi:hypothetical protein
MSPERHSAAKNHFSYYVGGILDAPADINEANKAEAYAESRPTTAQRKFELRRGLAHNGSTVASRGPSLPEEQRCPSRC